MAYSTAAAVRKETPFKDTTNISDALITQKIAEADNLINSMIGGQYALPLASTPIILVNLSKKIAGLMLYRDQATNIEVQPGMQVKDDWDVQMETLKSISIRRIKLTDDTTGLELVLNSSALPYGFPNTSSSDPSSPDNTSPAFTRSQASLFNKNRF